MKLEPIRNIAHKKINGLISKLGQDPNAYEIDEILITQYRFLFQVLPLRIYFYDLSHNLGEMEFESIINQAKGFHCVFEVATIIIDGKKWVYYLYSLEQFGIKEDDEEFIIDVKEFEYDFGHDIKRLLRDVSKIDSAYDMMWLRKLYVQCFEGFIKAIATREFTYELSTSMVHLCDDSFFELSQRMYERNKDTEYGGFLGNALDIYFSEKGFTTVTGNNRRNTTEAKKIQNNNSENSLRNNPIIWIMYAFSSPYYYSINPITSKKIIELNIKSLAITPIHVERINDLITFILEDVDIEILLPFARLTFLCAAQIKKPGITIYSASNLASALCLVNTLPALKEAHEILHPAYIELKNSDPKHANIDTIVHFLKRLNEAIDQLADTKIGWKNNLTEFQRRMLDEYNKKIHEPNFDEAAMILKDLLSQVEDRDYDVEFELNCLLGNILVGQTKIREAYKVLYTCENLLKKLSFDHDEGTFEIFKGVLLSKSRKTEESKKFLKNAIDRLVHKCSQSNFYTLLNNYVSVLAESDEPEVAIEVYKKYENILPRDTEDYVRINLNVILALNATKQFSAAIKKANELLRFYPDSFRPELKFDVNFHKASAYFSLYKRSETTAEMVLKAFKEATDYLEYCDQFKRHLFYVAKAKFLELSKGNKREIINNYEAGFKEAENVFLEVIRLTDDVNDRERLIDGLHLKVDSFDYYLPLYNKYIEQGDLSKLFSFMQRFKSKFIVETLFSNSENMLAMKLAKTLAIKNQKDLEKFTKRMVFFAELVKLDPGRLRKAAGEMFVKDGEVIGTITVLPISIEHLDAELFLLVGENLNRGEEIEKSERLDFVQSLISPETAIVEFFFVDEKEELGAILIENKSIRFLGTFPELSGFKLNEIFPSNVTAEVIESTSNNIKMYADYLESILNRELSQKVKNLVICPTGNLTNFPFSLLTARYHIIISPSSTLYALAVIRKRSIRPNDSIAMIDPCGDLAFSKSEISVLRKNPAVRFKQILSTGFDWEEFKAKFENHSLIHLSAHGFLNERQALFSGVKINNSERMEMLTVSNAAFYYFPNIESGLVILSSCLTGVTQSYADEFIGLPMALILGGAKTVIAPIWEVDEFATLLLIEFFYELLQDLKSASQSLRAAQSKLRNLTRQEIINKLHFFEQSDASAVNRYRSFLLQNFSKEENPYHHPYFWAGFNLYGSDIFLE